MLIKYIKKHNIFNLKQPHDMVIDIVDKLVYKNSDISVLVSKVSQTSWRITKANIQIRQLKKRDLPGLVVWFAWKESS